MGVEQQEFGEDDDEISAHRGEERQVKKCVPPRTREPGKPLDWSMLPNSFTAKATFRKCSSVIITWPCLLYITKI